jgi:hypothetical protein
MCVSFILNLFYLSRHIALTGQIFTIYYHWPKYSFSGTPVTCYMWSFGELVLNILKGAVIESISGDQPSVTVTFERPHVSVKAYAVLNILNLLIMTSSDESGNYGIMLYAIKNLSTLYVELYLPYLSIMMSSYFLLSWTCSIWAGTLHWLDKFLLYTITDRNIAFLVLP